VRNINKAVLNKKLTREQQALALQEATMHEDVRLLSKSAGIIDKQKHSVHKYIPQNMKHVFELASNTNNTKGRSTDDLRPLVQSIILSTLPSSEQQQERSIPSNTEIASVLGMTQHQYR